MKSSHPVLKKLLERKGCNKMMKTPVTDEGYKKKEEINCRRVETLKNEKKHT